MLFFIPLYFLDFACLILVSTSTKNIFGDCLTRFVFGRCMDDIRFSVFECVFAYHRGDFNKAERFPEMYAHFCPALTPASVHVCS